MKTNSASVSEHRLLTRMQLRLIFLYLIAFVLFETAVIGVAYGILSRQIMTPMYQSVTEEWPQATGEAITSLAAFQNGDQRVAVDTGPEVVANWVFAPNGQIVSEDPTLTSSRSVNLQSLATHLANTANKGQTTPSFSTHVVDGVHVLSGVKPIYQGDRFVGTIVSFRSLMVVHDAMEALMHIDIEIGIIAILLTVPVTYWLAHRSLTPVRTAMQRQRNFVNDAAHELRTPLTILHGTLELAEAEADSPSVKQSIHEGMVETEYITELIANLSVLARMESGVTELNLLQMDITALMQSTIAALQPLAANRNIELNLDAKDGPIILDADSHRIRQLAVILIDNALKYTNPGGRVSVQVQKQRGHVELKITDTGVGIPDADLPHIFDRFYRATSTENQTHGSGIGLAIAAWIVETHHGEIVVQSKHNVGTTFRILLPLHANSTGWKKVLSPKG